MTVLAAQNHQLHFFLQKRRALGLAASLALILANSTTFGQVAGSPDKNSAEWQVYTNDALFNQLSGPARARAELHFGKKARSKADSFGDDSSGWLLFPDFGAPATLVPNPLVNNPAEDTTSQDTQSETSLAVAGTNIVCGFNDSALYNGTTSFKFTGWSTSGDNGATWVDGISLPTNPDGDAGDPTLAYSSLTGTLLFGTLSLNIAQDLVIFRSADNGVTFTGPVQGAPGYTSATGSQDKDWLTCDNFVGPPGSGYGNFYYFWRNFAGGGGMTLTRSLDDGASFGPAPGILLTSGTGQGGNVIVGPDHSVYCFWFDSSVVPNRIVVRKSVDQGQTFGPIIVVTMLTTTGVNGDLALGGYRSNAFPQLAVNPVTGAIYIVYPDISGADHGNIYFRQSTDGGNTWSPAVVVNDDGTTRAQFQPGISCRPDGTGLAVSWYDRRRDPADAMIERWGAVASIVGNVVTFGPNFRLSPAFPAVFGVDPVVNGVYMGDYDQLAADNIYYYTSWGDNRDNSTAVPTRKNANVRLARFTQTGPAFPLIDFSSASVLGGNGNGLIDPDECNDLKVVLRNDGGGVPAANVVATLSTVTPGVTLIQSSSSYPSLAPGAKGTNTINFKVVTSHCYVCGTPITINLNTTYTGGSDSDSFNLPVNNSGYSITASSGASIVPGTTYTGNSGDDVTTTISLPFTYTFFGVNYITATLSSNGNIQFGTASTAFGNTCLPASGFTDAIYPHWDDLRTDFTPGTTGIFTSTSGAAPNRIFNIEWRATYYSPSGVSINFEARLYEGQQRVDFIYGNLNGTGASATVGVQHGTTVTSYECNSGGLSQGLQLTLQATSCTDAGGCSVISAPSISGNNFVFTFQTLNCGSYIVQYKNDLTDPTWQTAQTFPGDGSVKTFTTTASSARQFYRLQVQ
jgi:hypothetical protein